MFSTLKRNIAFAIVALTVAGGGAVAYAQGVPERPELAGEVTAAQNGQENAEENARRGGNRPGHPRGAIMRRAVHGDLVVRTKDGTFENVTFDRGKLTAVDTNAGTLTLERPDGVTVTVKLTADTKYRGVENASGLVIGKPVAVGSKDGTAVRVGQPKEATREMRPGRGPAGAPAAPSATN